MTKERSRSGDEAERSANAAPTAAMTHIALQQALDGKVVDWLEQVGDDQYQG